MSKKTRRNEMLMRLKSMTHETHRARSESIVQRFIASSLFQQSNTIGVTISRFPEVQTKRLIEEAWRQGKTVVVPRCNISTKTMTFRTLSSVDQLETTHYTLREPKVNETESVDSSSIDLLIVPGVVYSNEGYRIGFGGGYYDRYLMNYKGKTVSLAFTEQTGHVVPVESHDIAVDYIVSDTQWIDCKE